MSKISRIIEKIQLKRSQARNVSSAQTGEDLLVNVIRNLLSLKTFSWIDIGAHDPIYLSNTALFYKMGFRGINVEGDPTLIKKFHDKRKKDVNLNILAGPVYGEFPFFIMDPPTLNTMDEHEAERCQKMGYKIKEKITVRCLPIPQIIKEYANGVFPDFLSLDAEGFDLEILKSIEWDKTKPKIICVEIGEHSPKIKENFDYVNNSDVKKFLYEKGFFIFAYTFNNTIFIDKNLLS